MAESIEGHFIHIAVSRPLEGLIEESLEIVGATLLLIAFSEHYQWRQKSNPVMAEKVVNPMPDQLTELG